MKDWQIVLLLAALVYFLLRSEKTDIRNEERLAWTDYRGHEYNVVINRHVH